MVFWKNLCYDARSVKHQNIATCLNVCIWALLIVTATGILIANLLLRSLKGKAGRDGHNWTLGIRMVFLEPMIFPITACMQCSCVGYNDLLLAERSGDRIPVGGEIFCTRPDGSWRQSSLLYNGYRLFPEGKAAGAWRRPPTPSGAKVKERVGLYLYSPLNFRCLL